jgi:hypothetical protein
MRERPFGEIAGIAVFAGPIAEAGAVAKRPGVSLFALSRRSCAVSVMSLSTFSRAAGQFDDLLHHPIERHSVENSLFLLARGGGR